MSARRMKGIRERYFFDTGPHALEHDEIAGCADYPACEPVESPTSKPESATETRCDMTLTRCTRRGKGDGDIGEYINVRCTRAPHPDEPDAHEWEK